MMIEQAQPNVGPRIRALRREQGLSMQALAERCGLSANAISLIERGESSPTVSSLHRLATALEVPIVDLFNEETGQITVFVKRGSRPRSRSNGILLESLGTGLPDQQIEPFLMTFVAEAENTADPITHAGEEFVHCLEGEVEYRVGKDVYRMEAGDSLLFQATQPHQCCNVIQTPAKILLVFQAIQGRHLGREHYLDVEV
jgi:transcriptional regulator with XRE-family HTH domain